MKVILFLALTWLVYNKFLKFCDFSLWRSHQFDKHLGLISICFLLSPINWIFESKKWKVLLSPIQTSDFRLIASSILSGITLGIVTPARIGEYGGRIIHIEKQKRPLAAFAHFTGSLAQNIAIFLVGGICSSIYYMKFIFINGFVSASIIGITLIITILFLMVYFKNNWISQFIFSNLWIKKHLGEIEAINYDKKILDAVLLLSLVRHFIYMSQYVLLLLIFDVKISMVDAYVSIGLIYLLQSSLALPPALGLLARSELAIVILNIFEPNISKLLSIPLLLWAINLLIPAMIGMFVIMMMKIENSDE
jgi:hypothetical protein